MQGLKTTQDGKHFKRKERRDSVSLSVVQDALVAKNLEPTVHNTDIDRNPRETCCGAASYDFPSARDAPDVPLTSRDLSQNRCVVQLQDLCFEGNMSLCTHITLPNTTWWYPRGAKGSPKSRTHVTKDLPRPRPETILPVYNLLTNNI